MNTSLYVIAAEYRQIALRLAELDIDEQTIADTLESVNGPLVEKTTQLAMVMRNLEATAVQIKAAEASMAARRQKIEKRAERLRSYLIDALQQAGVQKITGAHFELTIRKNPPAVVIEPDAYLPTKFLRQPEPPPPVPDKTRIKDAIQNGLSVPGCRLVQRNKLEIR